jgi:hypothetical protein
MVENKEQYVIAIQQRDLLRLEIEERRVMTNLKSSRLRELNRDIQLWNAREGVKGK